MSNSLLLGIGRKQLEKKIYKGFSSKNRSFKIENLDFLFRCLNQQFCNFFCQYIDRTTDGLISFLDDFLENPKSSDNEDMVSSKDVTSQPSQ